MSRPKVIPFGSGITYFSGSSKITVRTRDEAVSHIKWMLSCIDLLERNLESLPDVSPFEERGE